MQGHWLNSQAGEFPLDARWLRRDVVTAAAVSTSRRLGQERSACARGGLHESVRWHTSFEPPRVLKRGRSLAQCEVGANRCCSCLPAIEPADTCHNERWRHAVGVTACAQATSATGRHIWEDNAQLYAPHTPSTTQLVGGAGGVGPGRQTTAHVTYTCVGTKALRSSQMRHSQRTSVPHLPASRPSPPICTCSIVPCLLPSV